MGFFPPSVEFYDSSLSKKAKSDVDKQLDEQKSVVELPRSVRRDPQQAK